jgi:hypothetical protein
VLCIFEHFNASVRTAISKGQAAVLQMRTFQKPTEPAHNQWKSTRSQWECVCRSRIKVEAGSEDAGDCCFRALPVSRRLASEAGFKSFSNSRRPISIVITAQPNGFTVAVSMFECCRYFTVLGTDSRLQIKLASADRFRLNSSEYRFNFFFHPVILT